LQAGTLKNRKNAPISRHPLFPAMVCLWFAALFGLGSLAIRPSLLESAVLALHIDLMVPAAAPPLGITARIILALGMFVIGAVIGLLLALRLARPNAQQTARRRTAKAAAMPDDSYGDNDDLARLDAARAERNAADQSAAAIPGRRRALAMEEQYERTHHDFAPVPGVVPPEAEREVQTITPHSLNPQILDLADLSMSAHGAEASELDDGSGLTAAEPPHQRAFDGPVAIEPGIVAAPVAKAPAELFLFVPSVEAVITPAPVAAQPVSAPILQPSFKLPRDGADKLRAAPLESLGVVQLAERLALAIARRRDGVTAAAAIAPVTPAAAETQTDDSPVAPGTFARIVDLPEPAADLPEVLVPEALEQALPVHDLGTPPPMPAALRPISFHDDGDDDIEPVESILPPRRFAMPTAVVSPAPVTIEPVTIEPVAIELVQGGPDIASDNDDTAENGYSSLLAIKAIVRQNPQWAEDQASADESVAADVDAQGIELGDDQPAEAENAQSDAEFNIEPVVIFPGQAQYSAPAAVPSADEPQLSASGVRRFDAPSKQPTPLRAPIAAVPSSGQPVDPLETERALKAALATLQRMSGAA
jgi:hypothetical protein